MNPQESALDYVFGDTLPTSGSTLEVAPGVRWVRMGLPFALDHINLWLLEDGDGWTLIDCGIANDATRSAWEQIFKHELQGKPVKRLIVTHCHPDHVGLASWLCERWQIPMWMTVGEYGFARMMAAGLAGADGPAAVPHFRRHGLTDAGQLAQLEGRKNYYPTLVPSMPLSFNRLESNQPVQIGAHAWQVIIGQGHSPEHAALYCQTLGVLISGDMVLPRISTNTSVFAIEPEANAVSQYLSSLEKFLPLDPHTLVLPSHGKPFRGLHERIQQLQNHHADRLAEVLQACATPQSAADIVPIMFKRALDMHQLSFALGEALAHLHWHWHTGTLKRYEDEQQVLRFVRT